MWTLRGGEQVHLFMYTSICSTDSSFPSTLPSTQACSYDWVIGLCIIHHNLANELTQAVCLHTPENWNFDFSMRSSLRKHFWSRNPNKPSVELPSLLCEFGFYLFIPFWREGIILPFGVATKTPLPLFLIFPAEILNRCWCCTLTCIGSVKL